MKFTEEQVKNLSDALENMDIEERTDAHAYADEYGLNLEVSVNFSVYSSITTTYFISNDIPREEYENNPIVKDIVNLTYEEFCKLVGVEEKPAANEPKLKLVKE